MASMRTHPSTGKKKAEFEIETRLKEARAVELRARNWKYDAIAKEVGWATEGAARHAVGRALDRHEEDDVARLRQVEGSKLDALERELWKVVDKKHYVAQFGKLVQMLQPVIDDDGVPVTRDNGTPVMEMQPLEDDAPRMKALGEILKVTARRAALRGLDAPLRKIVEVITEDAVLQEIRRIEAMMEELDGSEAGQTTSL